MSNSATATRFHTLVVLVENKAGVLARVAGLFSRRGFNIDSLAVAPTDDESFSRITIVVDAESAPLEQVVKQLYKLINVVDIRELDPSVAIERELLLATVTIARDRRSELSFETTGFDAIVLDENDSSVVLSFSGRPERVDEFEHLLRPYGIVEIQRTGTVALSTL